MNNDTKDSNPAYVLGHSDHEFDRLRAQARFLEPVTRQFLREAGIRQGMCVLDVGSGAGDVAFLASERVGEAGSVLGTDKAPAAVAAAALAAREHGLRNVHFREGNPVPRRLPILRSIGSLPLHRCLPVRNGRSPRGPKRSASR